MNIEGQYLNYNEYKSLGGLDIGEMPFKILEFEARQNVDLYTFGRLKELPEQVEEVKLCIYKLITIIKSYQNLEVQDKNITSESIDGYNIQYSNGTSSVDIKNNDIKDVIKKYLTDCKLEDGTPYLYRG